MNFLAVDDKAPVLRQLEDAVRQASPGSMVKGFGSAASAVEYARDTRIDAAFLDIDMPGMGGLELAKRLKDIYGQTNIIFVTGYAQYAVDAFGIPASGYILKPAEPEAIATELGRLRHPVTPAHTVKVRAECFGGFNVFTDDKPLPARGKVKEMLAYLVHRRGEFARSGEIAAALLADDAKDGLAKTNIRQVTYRLMKLLKDAGAEDIIIKKWDSIAVDVKKISCDYYDFLKRKTDGVNAYKGEYMTGYDWAEFTP